MRVSFENTLFFYFRFYYLYYIFALSVLINNLFIDKYYYNN